MAFTPPMAAPVFPNDFCQIKLSAYGQPCDPLNSLTRLLELNCQLVTYLLGSDGLPSDTFIADLSAKGLTGGGTDGSTNGLAAPSNVAATSNLSSGVKITWSGVASATGYTVYRGTSSATSSMTPLVSGLSGVTEYLDTSADVGAVYYYAMKASNSLLNSGFSAVATGKKVSAEGSTPHTYSNTAEPETFVIPAGWTSMTIELWGPGGQGGNCKHNGWIIPPNTLAYGGGGASGSYLKITGVTVTPGDVWVLAPGTSGDRTTIYKASYGNSINAYATGGGDGHQATSYSIPGVGGSPASSRGANNLGIGSIDEEDSKVGNPGEDGSTSVAGQGGAAISADDGKAQGKGSDGINSNTSAAPEGESGLIRLTPT